MLLHRRILLGEKRRVSVVSTSDYIIKVEANGINSIFEKKNGSSYLCVDLSASFHSILTLDEAID